MRGSFHFFTQWSSIARGIQMILSLRLDGKKNVNEFLCPATGNGIIRRPYETLNVGHGAYLVLHCAQEATQISAVTGDLTVFEGQYMAILPLPVLPELPEEPSRAVMNHMGPLLGYTWQKVQKQLTDAYRYLLWHSGLRYVRRSPIALFHPSSPPGVPVTSSDLRWGFL